MANARLKNSKHLSHTKKILFAGTSQDNAHERHKADGKKLQRLERVEKPKREAPTFKLNFIPETRGGNDILRCQDVSKAFDDKVIFANLNFEVYRRDVVGIIGANGTGKTTLFRMILGEEPPTHGEMWIGPTLKFGHYAQELEGLNPDNEIIDEIWELCPQQTQGEVRSFLGKFLFSGDDVFKRIGNLSGGEQSRVLLAKLLLENANVLLLDEPTNHLDIPAREALEAALAEYPATLFIISHDRYLLSNLATKLLIFDGNPGGTADLFEGNYAEYAAQQQQALQEDQPLPEKIQESQPAQPSQLRRKSKAKRKRKIKAQRLVGSN